MGTASRFDPGSLLCHRADHRAYAAGRIASITLSRQGVIGNRMHHSWVRSFDGAGSAPFAGNCPLLPE
jgi:hypothetical protein